MSDRCEPPEELRGVDGWHWVQNADWPATVNRWVWDAHEGIGFWHPHISEHTRYLAPVAPPAEVDALRAEVSEYCQTVQLLENRNATLRARVEALEGALRPFADAVSRFRDCGDAIEIADVAHDAPLTVGHLRAARAALETRT